MHGLYLLWWVQEKDMSPAVVAAVLAAGDLALIALELPTGWFADRFGHRASLMLGSLVQVVGMLWCWLGEGVPGLVTASVLVAVGDGFRSGADQALLYRTCLALGCEADFQKLEARSEAIALAMLVCLVLAGGVLVEAGGFGVGWLAETILCGAGFVIAWCMAEPPAHPDEPGEGHAASDVAPIRYRALAYAIVPAALLSGAATAASFLAQTPATVSVGSVTVLVALLTAGEAGGAAIASRLGKQKWQQQVLLAVGAIVVTVAILAPATLPFGAVALAFLAGIAEPLRAVTIQRLSADRMRARAASAASACDMMVSTILLPLAGVWRNRRR